MVLQYNKKTGEANSIFYPHPENNKYSGVTNLRVVPIKQLVWDETVWRVGYNRKEPRFELEVKAGSIGLELFGIGGEIKLFETSLLTLNSINGLEFPIADDCVKIRCGLALGGNVGAGAYLEGFGTYGSKGGLEQLRFVLKGSISGVEVKVLEKFILENESIFDEALDDDIEISFGKVVPGIGGEVSYKGNIENFGNLIENIINGINNGIQKSASPSYNSSYGELQKRIIRRLRDSYKSN